MIYDRETINILISQRLVQDRIDFVSSGYESSSISSLVSRMDELSNLYDALIPYKDNECVKNKLDYINTLLANMDTIKKKKKKDSEDHFVDAAILPDNMI